MLNVNKRALWEQIFTQMGLVEGILNSCAK